MRPFAANGLVWASEQARLCRMRGFPRRGERRVYGDVATVGSLRPAGWLTHPRGSRDMGRRRGVSACETELSWNVENDVPSGQDVPCSPCLDSATLTHTHTHTHIRIRS